MNGNQKSKTPIIPFFRGRVPFSRWLHWGGVVILILIVSFPHSGQCGEGKKRKSLLEGGKSVITLPEPKVRGTVSLEETLARRESVRSFSSDPVSLSDLSQLLWSAQGITRSWGGRTTPSAGALYPLELYVVLREGVFRYVPKSHQLIRHAEGDVRADLASAALGQRWVREAPVTIVITAVFERIERRYGRRGERYVKIEVGHAAQNIHLQAVALGLGSVPVGAYDDTHVKKVLGLPVDHEPLYLIPVGHRAK